FPQIFSHSPYMFTRDLIGGFGLTFRDGGEQPFVLTVDLVLVMRACIKMFDGGEHTSERQFTERFQQMREHSVVGSFADGTVKRVIETGMFLGRHSVTRFLGSFPRFKMPANQQKVGTGGA